MSSEFGRVLRRLRVQAKMTQEELAGRTGVSVRTIGGLETGQRSRSNPRMTTVQKLADALALRPEDRAELLRAAAPGSAGSGEGDSDQPEPARQDALADAAAQLAKAVAFHWQREEEQRKIQDPFPLPVRWKTGPGEYTDHWANISRLPPQAPDDALDLSGRLEEIAETYRRIPSGRLVVLGRSGSGKTILALRFVLEYLKSPRPAEHVPVIFSIGAWNPTTITLRDWLTEQLLRDYPGTAARGLGRASLAAELVNSGRVLPVLDGFDEIADGLRRPALEALNATTLPLLLTSRPTEYAAAVNETDVLTSAALIELTDLTLKDLCGYLPRTTRKADRANASTNAWESVLAELSDQASDGPAAPLSTVLTTPLMVGLARTVYSDTPDHDPASLLDTERFGSTEKLEGHLLESFIPTVYGHRRRPQHGAHDFDPERARRWLGYLAHLTQLETSGLAWWRFGNGLRRSTRTLITALVTGLVIGLVDCAVLSAFRGSVTASLADAILVGLLAGLMFGFVHWLTYTATGKHVTPSAVRLQIRGRPGTTWRTGPRLVIGTLGGAIFGFAYGFTAGMVHAAYILKAEPSAALHTAGVYGVVHGLIFSAAAGLTFSILGLLETPLDIDTAVNPRSILNTNRRTVATQLPVWALTFGAVVGFGSEAVVVDILQGLPGSVRLSPGLVIGTIGGVGGALGYALTLTAWGQWLVLTRIWLPLTGRLPWAVVTFLEDAYQRGVLRKAGAVYQFRHARLQRHLAQAHRALSASGRRNPQR